MLSIHSFHFFTSTCSWTHSNRIFIFSIPIKSLWLRSLMAFKLPKSMVKSQFSSYLSLLASCGNNYPHISNTLFLWLMVLFPSGFTHTSLVIHSQSPFLFLTSLLSILPSIITHSPGHLNQSHDFDFHQCTELYLYLYPFLWVLGSFSKLSFSNSPLGVEIDILCLKQKFYIQTYFFFPSSTIALEFL